MRQREPAFNLPKAVVRLSGLLILVHVARLFLPFQKDLELVRSFGFIPARYSGLAADLPGGIPAQFWSPLTYGFFHADLLHLFVNILWMAAFGAAVARRFGSTRFLVLFFLAVLGGAAAQYTVHPDDLVVMIGASAGISGLTAAAVRFAFAPGGPLAGNAYFSGSYANPAPPLLEVFRNPRSLTFIAFWFGINFLFGAGASALPGVQGSIAWEAHIGGFLVGLLLFPLLDPVRVDRGPNRFGSPGP